MVDDTQCNDLSFNLEEIFQYAPDNLPPKYVMTIISSTIVFFEGRGIQVVSLVHRFPDLKIYIYL